MDHCRISIIIPIYNTEKYLERCLTSVLNQTYKNFEALMINDGSTDNSASIAEEFSARDPRFRLINQENRGQGGARNTGIALARGEYLAFLDSDDWYDVRFLEKMLQTAEKTDADVVACGVERVWDNGIRKKNPISNSKNYTVEDKTAYLKTVSYVVWDKLYKKELFDETRFPEHMIYEDYAATPQVLAKASKIVCISDILYNYYWNINSTTNQKTVSRDILKAQRILEDSEFGKKYGDVLEAYFIRNVMGTLLWKMCLEGKKTREEMKPIIQYGLARYPGLKNEDSGRWMGRHKVLWGKLILDEQYQPAEIIVKLDDLLRKTFRKIRNAVGKIRNAAGSNLSRKG